MLDYLSPLVHFFSFVVHPLVLVEHSNLLELSKKGCTADKSFWKFLIALVVRYGWTVCGVLSWIFFSKLQEFIPLSSHSIAIQIFCPLYMNCFFTPKIFFLLLAMCWIYIIMCCGTGVVLGTSQTLSSRRSSGGPFWAIWATLWIFSSVLPSICIYEFLFYSLGNFSQIKLFCLFVCLFLFLFFFFLAAPAAYRSSWARDQTCTTAVTTPDP